MNDQYIDKFTRQNKNTFRVTIRLNPKNEYHNKVINFLSPLDNKSKKIIDILYEHILFNEKKIEHDNG